MQAERFKQILKRRVTHELEQFAILTTYLAFFFCTLSTYSMLLLNKLHISYFAYGTALINALLTAKVILIGEALNAGKKFEGKALLYSAAWKAFVFGWLVFALHLLEEMIKFLIHRKNVVEALHEIRLDDLLMRTIVIMLTFVPLFVFREMRRVMGEERLRKLLFQTPPTERRSAGPWCCMIHIYRDSSRYLTGEEE